MSARLRLVVAVVAALAVLGPLGWFWQRSLVPDSYDMAAMGYPDDGGGPPGHGHAGGLSVTDLTGPSGPADVSVALTARREGAGYTLNHVSPGPEIRARQGQLVEVRLVNESVPDGVTLHWHGVDVPNAEDGVAGVTQDAVPRGGSHVYRFVVRDAGTYWYHSHQVGHEQVRLGLFGALVVTPAPAPQPGFDADPVVAVHTYGGRRTVNGRPGVGHLAARPGVSVRARVINTDAGPIRVWVSGAAYRVEAVDGRDVHEPTPVSDTAVLVTAGGRIDVAFTVPDTGARVEVGAGTALVVGPGPDAPATAQPRATLDLLGYGTPAPLGFDPAKATRVFRYEVGRRPGFLDGRPGLWWTVNGHLFPDLPMFMVTTGDVVRMTIANTSGEVHPMHLHGHHAVVLSRNGAAATGSPWWVDSLDVGDDETYEIAFVADNPGIWVDHCHNLQHAAEGLLAHLAYHGVSTPYRVGGAAGNQPE
ncbi:FtsP/CotA-like multicopper oxidase with cupredoxin domain [Krasilnikovia cinnamomea]|uniref:FtsP/CotA-like multicopper oxidase with cupredoxin domain n=1 Tax=Krasilnikovia cinnamomea TaxID=349313 RepID=A0A4Q7ZFT2_9ACTN|nr:multicopper oxidase family protein [Krasilnikovia cinnamomea]RZU49161.1 FtsP/CotA-like multicopper oxidase with cupredoxin domain [Krasilnikovia cinnamomea]